MNRAQQKLLYWGVLIMIVIAIYNWFAPKPRPSSEMAQVPFAAVMKLLTDDPDEVMSVRISGGGWEVKRADGSILTCSAPPLDASMIPALNDVALDIFRPDSWKKLILGSWVPMFLAIVAFWGPVFWMRKQIKAAAKTSSASGKSVS